MSINLPMRNMICLAPPIAPTPPRVIAANRLRRAGIRYVVKRSGRSVSVTAIGDGARASSVYYYWFRDGVFVGITTTPRRTFQVRSGQQAAIEAVIRNSPDVDPSTIGAVLPSGKVILEWVRSDGSDEVAYRIQQKQDAGSYTTIARVPMDGSWSYRYETGKLDDLSEYTWKIIGIDAAGNVQSSGVTVGPITIVRRPDAPDCDFSYDSGTARVTIGEAS